MLSARTGFHCHVGVHLKNHILIFIEEQDAERRHFVRNTARLRNARDYSDCSHYTLDGGMVGWLQGLRNGELAFPRAVIGIKGFRGNNPLAPANICKIHLEIAPGAIPWLIPLLPPRLLQGLLIKLQSLALLLMILPLLFLTLCPLCQTWLECFV